jgi:hypothetical protein
MTTTPEPELTGPEPAREYIGRLLATVVADVHAADLVAVEPLPEPQADNYGHPHAVPLGSPQQWAEAQVIADELDRNPDPCSEPEADAEADYWNCAGYDAEAAEYDVEPEAGI